jgi:leucine efflux protein
VARKLSSLPFARKLATRLAGGALLGFGVKLALDNR